ncbi:MAG: hypothetical protein LBH64_00330 [Coriobacteriales bacterium]|nr:hypothetical protein [Coriobacteriales bacterium]
MTAIEVSCSRCGGEEYRLIDASTGEVVCLYCRNRWIIPELIQKTETEKYLVEQAKQPRITYDNTTETDKQLMDVVSGLAGTSGLLSSIGRALTRFLRVVLVVIVIVIIALAAVIALRVLN